MKRQVTCARCGGAKVLYRHALGDASPSEFRLAELLQLLAQNLVQQKGCTTCGGRGVVDMNVVTG